MRLSDVPAITDHVHLGQMGRSQEGSSQKVVPALHPDLPESSYNSQVTGHREKLHVGINGWKGQNSGRRYGTDTDRSNIHNKHPRDKRINSKTHMQFLLPKSLQGGIDYNSPRSGRFRHTNNSVVFTKAHRTNHSVVNTSRTSEIYSKSLHTSQKSGSPFTEKRVVLYSRIIALLTPNILAQRDIKYFHTEGSMPKEIIVNITDGVAQFWCNICRTLTIETQFCKYILSRVQHKCIEHVESVSNNTKQPHGLNTKHSGHPVQSLLPQILNVSYADASIQNHVKTSQFDTTNNHILQRKLLSMPFVDLDGQQSLNKNKDIGQRARRSEHDEPDEGKNGKSFNMTEYIELVERLRQYRSKDPMWAIMSCVAVLAILAWAAWACGMRRIDRSREINVDIEDEFHFVSIREIIRLRRPFLPKRIFKLRMSRWKYSRLRELEAADLTNPVPGDYTDGSDDVMSNYSEERDVYSPLELDDV